MVTVIEALRAFDIVYVINNGRNGLELLSVLVTDNIIGEASRIGYGSAIAVVLITISIIPIIVFVWNSFQEVEDVTDAAPEVRPPRHAAGRSRRRQRHASGCTCS